MNYVFVSALREWQDRLEREIERLEDQIKVLNLDDESRTEIVKLVSRKNTTLIGIEDELEKQAR